MTSPVPARGDRSRSLRRGIEILRAFRPGSDLYGNGELAERTGLSRATVSRLAQTLVDCGMLEHDRRRRAYRLAPLALCLAQAMRTGSPVLAAAGPLMRKQAERHKINIGLAAADRDEMVYLESVRYSPRVSWRTVVAGQRVPMELTSLGRAFLAATSDERRNALLAHFRSRRRTGMARAFARDHQRDRECPCTWILLGFLATGGRGTRDAHLDSRLSDLRAEHERRRELGAGPIRRGIRHAIAEPGASDPERDREEISLRDRYDVVAKVRNSLHEWDATAGNASQSKKARPFAPDGFNPRRTPMTDVRMALTQLLAKGSAADPLREMAGYVAQRLMELELATPPTLA